MRRGSLLAEPVAEASAAAGPAAAEDELRTEFPDTGAVLFQHGFGQADLVQGDLTR